MWKPADRRLLVAGLATAFAVAACTGGASPSPAAPSGSAAPTGAGGSPAPSPSSPTGQIAHPTGANELVLRFSEGGGFVAPNFALVETPYFSLYGDGTVIYRPVSAAFPEQKQGQPMRFPPLQVATMTEAQVQALLADGLGAGGLGVAKPRYDNGMVADAPTAVFVVNADGRQKQVTAYALGFGSDPANPKPDDAILEAMAAFAERLRNFDQEVAKGNATDVGLYRPDRFRASLLEGGFVEGPARSWPWPTFGPDAFTVVDQDSGFGFASKVLSGLEMSVLGLENPEGGVSGIALLGPDGKTYVLGLRPLLPDEQR